MASVLLPVSLLLAVLLLIPELFGDFTAYQIGLYLIYGIAAQGIGFLWGKTGVLPLGQALVFGVAAYVTAITLRAEGGLVLDLILAVGVLVAMAVFAFILAALIFRGRTESGPYFSLITLALVMIAEQIAGTATNLTGGFNGISGFSSLGKLDPFGGFHYVIVAATVAVSLLLFILNRLPVNLIARAVADNEPRLQLLGFPTHVIKGAVFAFSAVIAALAGGLFASHQGIVTPTSTGFAMSAEMVILAAVGGRFHVLGPLIGAVIVGWASAELRDSFPYWELLTAVAFILVVLKAPGGIAELLETAYRRFKLAGTTVPQPTMAAPKPKRVVANAPLKFDDVQLSVGVVRILNGVSFETPATGIVSIIGPNGAGKTSALNTISGNIPLTGGRMSLGDARIDSRPPHKALGSGTSREAPDRYFERFPRLAERLDQPAGTMSGGERKILAFVRAMIEATKVIILDEPSEGVQPENIDHIAECLRERAAQGAGVMLCEQNLTFLAGISSWYLGLDAGTVVLDKQAREVSEAKMRSILSL